MEKEINYNTMTYSYPDGSGFETYEHRQEVKIVNEKWRERNFAGKPNVKEMFNDFDKLLK